MGEVNQRLTRGTAPKRCLLKGCPRKHDSGGLCSTHYRRFINGRPLNEPIRPAPGSLHRWIDENVGHNGDDCLNWPFSKIPKGYGVVKINGVQTTASRAMCIAAHGYPSDESMEAAHICGNGHNGCVNPKHLRWATRADNQNDRKIHRTDNCGARNGRAKIDESDVKMIISMKGMATRLHVAAQFDISPSHVGNIWNGRTWKHLHRKATGGDA